MQTPKGAQKNIVMYVASHDDFEPMARAWLKDFHNLQFIPSPPLEILVEGAPTEFTPKLILLDGRGDSQRTLEWTQTLKMAFNVPLVVFYDSTAELKFSILKKNGADSLLHLYFDSEFIVDKLLDLVDWEDDGMPALGLLNPVAVDDLSTEMDLNFDVYVHLPGNQKSILVRRKGSPLDQKLIDRVKGSHQNVYFKKSQLKFFLEYSRTSLSMKNSEERMGVTDKVLKTRQRIQEIVSQFFDQGASDYKEGKVILDNCEKIIEDLEIQKWTDPQKVIQNIVLFTGRPPTYYNNMMTLCILGAGLGYLLGKKPEEIKELALAGLLHNVGIAYMTSPVLEPDLENLPPEDRKQYLNYPERTVAQIKSKKVPLPQAVTDLILQHRESAGGGGFPKGSDSSTHHPLSRVLQFAYILMQLTRLENDKPKHTISGALNQLHEEMLNGRNLVDATLLLTVKKKVG